MTDEVKIPDGETVFYPADHDWYRFYLRRKLLAEEIELRPKPKPIPLRCRLGLHAWGRWGQVARYGTSYGHQNRHCLACGKQDQRSISCWTPDPEPVEPKPDYDRMLIRLEYDEKSPVVFFGGDWQEIERERFLEVGGSKWRIRVTMERRPHE